MQVELLEGSERRRRWSFEAKARIVEASFASGMSVCSVARRHGIAQGLLFTWRRQAREGRLGGDEQAPVLMPVAITPEPSPSVPALRSDDPGAQAQPRSPRRKTGVMEIDLGGGRRLMVDRDVWDARLRSVATAAEAIRAELRQAERKAEQVMERILAADSATLVSAYEGQFRKLEEHKAVLVEKMRNAGKPRRTFEATLRTALGFLANPYQLWVSGRLEDRRLVLRLTFADRLSYDRHEGLRTANFSLPFKALAALQSGKKGWWS